MNSLKEEIKEIIKEKNPLYSQLVDITIAEIEKRINERIQELEQERKEIPSWDMSEKEKEIQDILSEHRIDELQYIKEMLK